MTDQPEFLFNENKDNSHAYNLAKEYTDRITSTPSYKRPIFLLPDLSGETGNTLQLAGEIFSCLRNHGFLPEARLLAGGNQIPMVLSSNPLILKTSYEDHPNLISKFLNVVNQFDNNFSGLKKQLKDISNYPLFIEVSKSDNTNNIKNINQDELKDINNFNRNVLFYINNNNNLLIDILKSNKKNDFFNIFQKDVFGQTPLHNSSDINKFNIIANEMFEKNKKQFKQIFNEHDIFGNGCFMTLNKVLFKVRYSSDENKQQTIKNSIAQAVAYGCFVNDIAKKELLKDHVEEDVEPMFLSLLKHMGVSFRYTEDLKKDVINIVAKTKECLLNLELHNEINDTNKKIHKVKPKF